MNVKHYVCYNDPEWTDKPPYGNKVVRIEEKDFIEMCERLSICPDNFFVSNWCWNERWEYETSDDDEKQFVKIYFPDGVF